MSEIAQERLNRFLARRGVASRRHADELIAAGRVTVNGRVGGLGATVDPDRDVVLVDGGGVGPIATVTLALNKPAGVMTTVRDPHHRATVMQLVPAIAGLVPVGRLDADTRGLLLLTTDGDLAHRLTHPRFGVRKRYQVTAAAAATAEQLSRLRAGVQLDDGPARAIEASAGNRRHVIELAMGEGRKREVRRMCAAVGLHVIDLLRVAVGPIDLGDLPEGSARRLTDSETSALRAAVGLGDD